MPAIVVSTVAKQRLEDMRVGMEQAKGRVVTYAEVIEALLAEHDAALEDRPV